MCKNSSYFKQVSQLLYSQYFIHCDLQVSSIQLIVSAPNRQSSQVINKMKFISLSFLLLSLSNMSIVRGQTDSHNEIPVQIEVTCDGMNAPKLDTVSATVFGQVLEESYTISLDSQITGSFVKVSEDASWPYSSCGSLCRNNDDTYKRRVRRPPTANENEISFEDVGRASDAMYFEGHFTCGSFCADGQKDVDMLFSTIAEKDGSYRGGSNGSIDMVKWENHFIRSLIDTRRNDFRAFKDCKITMKTGDADTDNE
jgi:hypothetical protein